MAAAKIKTKHLAVLSVSTAIQVVLLIVCLIMPTVKVSMLFAASLLNGILCAAGYKKSYVFLSFIAVSILSMIFISNYIIPVSYSVFFGAYGIVHIATKIKRPIIRQLIRFAYLAIGLTVLYLIFTAVFTQSVFLSAPYIFFLPLIIIAGYIAAQVLYDLVVKEFFKHNYLKNLIVD